MKTSNICPVCGFNIQKLNAEIQKTLINVRNETWNNFSDSIPTSDELILVTNGSYVEIAYMENGSIKKPWKYDEHDKSTFKHTDKGIMWKYINLPKKP